MQRSSIALLSLRLMFSQMKSLANITMTHAGEWQLNFCRLILEAGHLIRVSMPRLRPDCSCRVF